MSDKAQRGSDASRGPTAGGQQSFASLGLGAIASRDEVLLVVTEVSEADNHYCSGRDVVEVAFDAAQATAAGQDHGASLSQHAGSPKYSGLFRTGLASPRPGIDLLPRGRAEGSR